MKYQRPSEIIKQGWCQYYFAKDDEGRLSNPTDNEATCFCIMGAVRKTFDDDHSLVFSFLEEVQETIFGNKKSKHDRLCSVADWQDAKGRTQQEVVDVLVKTENKTKLCEWKDAPETSTSS